MKNDLEDDERYESLLTDVLGLNGAFHFVPTVLVYLDFFCGLAAVV